MALVLGRMATSLNSLPSAPAIPMMMRFCMMNQTSYIEVGCQGVSRRGTVKTTGQQAFLEDDVSGF